MADYSTDFEKELRTYTGENVTLWLSSGPPVPGVVDSFGRDCIVLKDDKSQSQLLIRLENIVAARREPRH